MGKSVKEGTMPKEFINNRWYGQTARSHDERCLDAPDHDFDNCPGFEVNLDSGVVKVGWTKDRDHVEIAVCEEAEGLVIEHAQTSDDSGPRYIQMDRAGLNRLIKVLRQARDDAFGKDA